MRVQTAWHHLDLGRIILWIVTKEIAQKKVQGIPGEPSKQHNGGGGGSGNPKRNAIANRPCRREGEQAEIEQGASLLGPVPPPSLPLSSLPHLIQLTLHLPQEGTVT